jgi:recombination protein RecT
MAETKLYTANDEGLMIQKLFTANLPAIKKQAPRYVGDPARLIRIAYNTIVYDEKLRKCTQASLVGGVLEALKLGLTLGGPMQEAWLIPFNDNRNNCMVATFIIGYQGYRNIIDRGRSVLAMYPRVVHNDDVFSYKLGDDPRIFHDPPFKLVATEKDLRAAYCVAVLRGNVKEREVMEKAEIDAHRARSRAKNSGPWVTDYPAMALKTTIRKMSKYLPKSSELLARALDLDERADRGVDQDFELEGMEVFDGSLSGPKKELDAAKPSGLDALKDQLTGKREPVPAELKDQKPLDENAELDAEIERKDRRG